MYPFKGSLAGTLAARLEIDDDFATDNRAYLAVSDAPPVRLLYVGPGNPFLSSLLRFFPNVQVTAAQPGEPDASHFENQYDLVIFDRVPVPSTEARAISFSSILSRRIYPCRFRVRVEILGSSLP